MFFLLRVAFWLGIVIMLLPTKETQPHAADAPSIGAGEAIGAAAAAIADLRGFCKRQPEACEVGAQAAQAFSEKAQAGARMVYELITEAAKDGAGGTDKPATQPAGEDTLSEADRALPWRGPASGPERLARSDPS